jgi:GntR family transcriptional regulator, vanillate catabolism transcriptional regulator
MSQQLVPEKTIAKEKSIRDSASQVARATQGLRRMLLQGEFHPGERIAEIPLSAKLGVSRTPMRLAFEKLRYEGLIKPLPNSGFAASEFSIDDIWDVLETRGVLEGAAARLAAERLLHSAEVEPLRRIENSVEELLKSGDIEEFTDRYLDLNEDFHGYIVELSHNQSLRRMLSQLFRLPFTSPSAAVLIYKNAPEAQAAIRSAREHHRGLIEAIERREGARAEALAREHCRLSRQNLEIALANRTLLNEIPGGRMIRFPHAGEA